MFVVLSSINAEHFGNKTIHALRFSFSYISKNKIEEIKANLDKYCICLKWFPSFLYLGL